VTPGRRSVALLALLAGPAAAQTPGPAGITASDIRRQIDIIAADSMLGRATPSPGLERAAAYVAGEFRRLGLRPAGTRGYEQRWAMSRWTPDTLRSTVEFAAGGSRVRLRLGAEARYVSGRIAAHEIRGRAVLLDAASVADPVGDEMLRDRIVLLPAEPAEPLLARLVVRAAAVLIVSDRDSATFGRRLRSAGPRWTPEFRHEAEGAPVLEIHEAALAPLPSGAPIEVRLRLARRILERTEVPNLVGALQGTDASLRREYVLVSAHLDGVGIRPGAPDSVNNGADDNASGVAGLLELAEAFRGDRRTRRSLLFLSASGEERGLWGSEYFVGRPTVPLSDIVAVVNLDLIGRNWPDSVIASGPELTTLGKTLDRVVTAHPELRMTPLADRWPEERIFYRSDHYHFARAGVPVLFFTSGTHPDYHQPTDAPDRVDAEKTARLVRLLYHLVVEIADAPGRPRWLHSGPRCSVTESC
jgi:hypothetical protein